MIDMKESLDAFKNTLKVLKSSKRASRRQFKADRLVRILQQKRRFSASDVFYGKPEQRFIHCAYRNPAATLRAGVVFNDSVQFEALETALYDTAASLPSLRLNVRKGFFSPYLQAGSYVPALSAPSETARAFFNDKTAYEFRVSFYKHRVDVELSGYLGDFHSLNRFVSCLALRYLELCGEKGNVSSCHYLDRPSAACLDDPFRLVDCTSYAREKSKFLKLKGDEDVGITNLTCFQADRSLLQAAANGDVNAFLVSLWSQAVKAAKGESARVGSYVNGRTFYPTDSMRSFSVLVPYDENRPTPDKTAFDRAAAYNLRGQSAAVRYLPMFVKTLSQRAKKRFSAVYADAGELTLHPAPSALRFEGGYMGAEPLSLTKADFKNSTTLTILSKFADCDAENEFYRLLPKDLNVCVGTNRRNNIV